MKMKKTTVFSPVASTIYEANLAHNFESLYYTYNDNSIIIV